MVKVIIEASYDFFPDCNHVYQCYGNDRGTSPKENNQPEHIRGKVKVEVQSFESFP